MRFWPGLLRQGAQYSGYALSTKGPLLSTVRDLTPSLGSMPANRSPKKREPSVAEK